MYSLYLSMYFALGIYIKWFKGHKASKTGIIDFDCLTCTHIEISTKHNTIQLVLTLLQYKPFYP